MLVLSPVYSDSLIFTCCTAAPFVCIFLAVGTFIFFFVLLTLQVMSLAQTFCLKPCPPCPPSGVSALSLTAQSESFFRREPPWFSAQRPLSSYCWKKHRWGPMSGLGDRVQLVWETQPWPQVNRLFQKPNTWSPWPVSYSRLLRNSWCLKNPADTYAYYRWNFSMIVPCSTQ